MFFFKLYSVDDKTIYKICIKARNRDNAQYKLWTGLEKMGLFHISKNGKLMWYMPAEGLKYIMC